MGAVEASALSSDEATSYDVFVSYARLDNASGWLTALVQQLAAAVPPDGSAPLRVFFDRDEVVGMDLWRRRLEGALRRSRALLVCVSPAWEASETCRWEWEVFHRVRAGRRVGIPVGLGLIHLAPLAPVDPMAPAEHSGRAMRQRIHETQTLLDLQPGSAAASAGLTTPAAWAQPAARPELQRMLTALWAHVGRERQAARAQGNLRGGNPHFVGRTAELAELHRALAHGRAGVILAVQGLGGIGKTELALQYAYEHAWHYTAGLWQVAAEGHRELLPLLATLAQDSAFLALHGEPGAPLRFTPAEHADARALGRAVLQAVLRRAQRLRDDEQQSLASVGLRREPVAGGDVLIVLDNVDQPELLSQRELVTLPELNQAHDRIRLLATSRLGRDQLTADAVALVSLDWLSDDDAEALMRTHRRGVPYPDAAYKAAVADLLRVLGGYTLAVEQVAIYLALNPSVRPEALRDVFRSQGLDRSDRLVSADERLRGEMLHRERLFDVVLGQTLKSLDGLPIARTALEHAAWLPPDHVPWGWLEAIVRDVHADLFVRESWQPDPWVRAQERLVAMQLLTPGPSGAARLHRLIGDHLRLRESANGDCASRMRVDAYAEVRAFALEKEFERDPSSWYAEFSALLSLALHWQQQNRVDSTAALVADIAGGLEMRERGSSALLIRHEAQPSL